jgi:hypothetical protein
MSPWPLELGATKPGSKVNRFTSSVFTNPFRRRNYAGKKTRKRFLDYVFHQKSLVTPAQVLFAYPDFGNSHFFWDFFSLFLAEFLRICENFGEFTFRNDQFRHFFRKFAIPEMCKKNAKTGSQILLLYTISRAFRGFPRFGPYRPHKEITGGLTGIPDFSRGFGTFCPKLVQNVRKRGSGRIPGVWKITRDPRFPGPPP